LLTDRRRARRRRLSLLRSGVLEVDGRNHIVSVSDIGSDGAFLTTRVPVSSGTRIVLKMILPSDSHPVSLPCEVVWRSEAGGRGNRSGVAVRFAGADESIVRRVEEFAAESRRSGRETGPSDHFEYRIVDVPSVDAEELNRVGVDGWQVASALPDGEGLRLILCRRL
jgi:Tfp pilus assembly protein PilZ